jgi:hypothetical protein
MTLYKVFLKNYDRKKGELIGMLIERRKDLRGMSQVESGLRWARLKFGREGKNKKDLFVVPIESNFIHEPQWLKEKAIWTKEELLGLLNFLKSASP